MKGIYMQVSNNCPIQSTNFRAADVKKADNAAINLEIPNDVVELSTKQESSKTKEEKQEILQEARSRAAGWSVLFGVFDTLYYGLRSDEKVAEQFDLDVNKDKNFIKTIKRQQMLCTLPSLIPGFGIVPGVACWLYNKNLDTTKLEV